MKLNIHKLEQALNALNIHTIQLGEEERSKFFSIWRKHFLPTKYFEDNHNTEWHTFSFNLLSSLSGNAAIDAFEKLFIKRFYIHSSNPETTSLECVGDKMIPYNQVKKVLDSYPFGQDLYIHHHNFKWTFVITHESDFGPYFCNNPIL